MRCGGELTIDEQTAILVAAALEDAGLNISIDQQPDLFYTMLASIRRVWGPIYCLALVAARPISISRPSFTRWLRTP